MAETRDPRHALWYQQPAQRWTEALPIGNGRLGAMVFGGIASERFQLNEDTLWSGGPREWNNPRAREVLPEVRRLIAAGEYHAADALCHEMQGPFNQSYQPLGDLLLDFAHGEEASAYSRELDLATAVATTRYSAGGVRYTREAFVSAPDQVLVVRLASDTPAGLHFTARLTSQLQFTTNSENENELVLRGVCPANVEPSYRGDLPNAVVYREGEGMRFEARLLVLAEGGTIQHSDATLHVAGADSVLLLLAAGTSFNSFLHSPSSEGRDPATSVLRDLAGARQQHYRDLYQAHRADHQLFFDRVALDLGTAEAAHLPTDQRIRTWHETNDPALVSLLFQYGRYLLITSSRPCIQAANLQGIWNDEVRPPWSANWTLNINAEMNYWLAEVANLAECHTPLFDLIEGLSLTGSTTAAVNYGCGGWVAHHNTDIWRQSSPPGTYGNGDPVWAQWAVGGGWLCQHLWEHYAFGGDTTFLGERAYPLMRGAAQFFLDWLVEDGQGHLVTMPSTWPENKFTLPDGSKAAVSMATTMDREIIWDLFTNCIAAAQVLGIDAEFATSLQAARTRLLPLQIGRLGQLQEWSQDWDDPEDTHRHASHMFGVYPGCQITAQATPDLFAAARRSLELRGDGGTGWAMAWKINMWARLMDSEHAYNVLGNMLTLVETSETNMVNGGGVYANLFDAHPPFQIDGNFGATAGIAELLLHSHAGEIHLLPTLPAHWPNGAVRGLRARGGFEIDITWEQGQLVQASILATRGGACCVRTAAPHATVRDQHGNAVSLEQRAPQVLCFTADAGQRYQLVGEQ